MPSVQRCCSTELAGDDSFLEFGDAIADLPPWASQLLIVLGREMENAETYGDSAARDDSATFCAPSDPASAIHSAPGCGVSLAFCSV